MSHMLDRNYRFSEAAEAIDSTQRSLRSWLKNEGNISLLSPDDDDSKQRKYSLGDIAVLALMRRLVDIGILVKDANDIALQILAFFPHAFTSPDISSLGFLMCWETWEIRIIKDGDDWIIEPHSEFEAARGYRGPDGNFIEVTLPETAGNDIDADAYITLKPHKIFTQSFARVPADGDHARVLRGLSKSRLETLSKSQLEELAQLIGTIKDEKSE